MKLTKYQHACFSVEKDNQIVVVDPGEFSNDFIAPERVVAVIITHQHSDHFDPERLAEIFAKNDEVLVLGPADVIETIEIENKRIVMPGETVHVGPFDFEFFGGIHTLIHESLPRPQNLGVMINDLLFYPGDSLVSPQRDIDVLALPVVAPWLRISDAIDYLLEVKPRLVLPTHDAIASENGKEVVDRMLSDIASEQNIDYQRISGTLEI